MQGRGSTNIGRRILDGQGYAERIHSPVRGIPQLAKRREAPEQAKRRIGAEERGASICGHDEAVCLVSATERERCLRRNRPRVRAAEPERELRESRCGPDGREVLRAAPDHEAAEIVSEEEGAGATCGGEEVMGRVGDRDCDGEAWVEAQGVRAGR